jgi:arylsulfatase A-like enzyme
MGEPETPLNVLLITCDQWRGDTLGCAGHPVVRTPSLDSLAADGVRFEKHYCQATPCGPSRASLYTGMYQLNTRVVANGTPLSARHSNIALELRRGGYDPVLSGYTDQANDPSTAQGALDPLLHYYGDALPGLRSLNTHPGGSSGHLAVSWVQQLQERGYTVPADMITVGAAKPFGTAEYASAQMPGAVLGGDVDPSRIVGNGGQFMHATHPDGSPVAAFYKPEDGDTAFCVDQVLRHVGSRQGAPWCCHLSAFKPHPPWLAAAPFNEHYTPAQAGLPTHRAASIAEEGKLHPWLAHRLSQTVSTTPDDDAAVALLRSQYWAVCEETDAQLGRLFAALRERGEWERTLIVFTTGEQLDRQPPFISYSLPPSLNLSVPPGA